MMNHFTLKCRRVVSMVFLLMAVPFAWNAQAQGIAVTGRVTDNNGIGLPGVNVLVKGTASGTATDANGAYSLNVNDANATLVISFIGFATQEVSLNGRTNINVVLQPDTQTLGEVVVVGYGTQYQRNVTGAVQQLNEETMKDIPVAQLTQKLQGRLAGVQISQATGKPGTGMTVRIRGQASIFANSDPLYVVDGFPITGDISNINPDEIESISVLKDAASAALYGSRAANGVVLITTKHAKAGQTTVDFNTYVGTQVVPERGRPKMMNGEEFAQFKKESYEDLGQTVPAAFENPSQYGEGYDWYDGMLRHATIQNYNVTINSGGEKARTTAVMGYFDQAGALYNSGFQRYSIRLNSDFDVNDMITTGFGIAPNYSINNSPSSDGAFYGGGLLYNALLTYPILPYKNPDGTLPLTAYIPGVSVFPTPNWFRNLNEVKNETKTTRLVSNAYLQVEPVEGLKIRSSINIDLNYDNFEQFKPNDISIQFFRAPPVPSTMVRRSNRYTSWLNENTIAYDKTIQDHAFELLVGFSSQKYNEENQQISANTFPDDRIETVQSAVNIDRAGNPPGTNMQVQEWSLLSYPARLNYSYKDKYLLSVAARRDGSSRFGSDDRWGNFWSVSGGWIISDESFMSGASRVSYAKLRASYGVTGNNNIGNYTQYATVNTTTNAIFGSVVAPGASVTALENPNLGWETTKQMDIGLDLGFFEDRVSIGYDYYLKHTTNLLYNVAVPQESGFTNFNGNVGELKFSGNEFTVSSRNLVGNLRWTTDANISFNKNEVVSLAEGIDQIITSQNGYATNTRVGHSVGEFWGLMWDGVYVDQNDFDNSPKYSGAQVGTIKYKDVNNDGVVILSGNNDDRTFIGNPFPKFIYGIRNTFTYKNLELSIFGSGTHGNDVLVMLDQGITNLDGVFNVLADVKDRWHSPSDPGAGRYGKTTSATSYERDNESSRFVSPGSNFTIKNITLGYDIPLGDLGLRSLRLYGGIQQVYVFTKYRGPNPEASGSINGTTPTSSLQQGFDWGTYPVPRTYTLGLNIGL